MAVAVGLSLLAVFIIGFITGMATTTRQSVNKRLAELGLTKNTVKNMQETVKILKWIRSEEVLLGQIYLPESAINKRIDRVLEDIRKEYE